MSATGGGAEASKKTEGEPAVRAAARPQLFFETTIFAEWMFGYPAERKTLAGVVASREIVTSHYVREQFRATFLRATIHCHTRLTDRRDCGLVRRDFDNFKYTRTPGDGVKCRKVFETLLEPGGDVNEALETLARWIEIEIPGMFAKPVKVVDETKCEYCLPPSVVEDENGLYKFDRACQSARPKNCSIVSFWSVRKAELQKLAALNPALQPDGLKSMPQAASQLLGGETPHGKRCTVFLSDTTIYCEAPDGADVATTNLKDFEPIHAVLGLKRSIVNPLR